MTAHPKPGTVLTEDSVKLLLPGDVLRCINPHTRAHKLGAEYVFEERTHNAPGEGNDIRIQGSRLSTWSGIFAFVSRPSLEPPASDVAGWRPIETAPKDGTWIQAWRTPPGFMTGMWEPLVYVRWEDEEGAWVWPDETYQVFTEYGIERANLKIAEFSNFADKTFTHWQPLPAPPQPSKEPAPHE